MSTAGELVDRVYREWLYRPDDQPIRTTITSDLNESTSQITFTVSQLTTEEQNLLAKGQLIEIDRELMRITNVALTSSFVNVLRGVMGTTAATHSASTPMYLAPTFPRQTVFDAVADAIVDLYPDLWHTRTTDETLDRDWVEVPAESYAIGRALIEYGGEWVDAGARFLSEFPSSRTGKAVQFSYWSSGRVLLTMRERFTRPTDETTEIADIEPDWEQLVVLGAVANILGATDLDSVRQEYVTETFQAQGYPVGSGERLSRAAIRLYEYKLEKAKRELKTRYPTPTTMSGTTYGGF